MFDTCGSSRSTNRPIKAVFLDFDGTLFSHSSISIPASAIKAITLLKEKGIRVFLCTGRAPAEMDQFDLNGLLTDAWILCNGQIILDENGKIIYEKQITGELKDLLISLFNEKKTAMYLINRTSIYLNMVNNKVRSVQSIVSSGIPPVREYEGEEIYMASAFFANEEDKKILEKLEGIGEATWWGDECVDIIPPGVSKTIGIDEILKRYGIDIEETLAVGDGENDTTMLEHCAIGIAMGNSYEELKKHADYVTDDIDEDGLYNALKHYRLF